jgi:isoleucyl-tRNA synthetase
MLKKQLSDSYFKIRNTFRFALSNLFDFDPVRDALPASQLRELDAWMLRRTSALVAQCLAWYQSFEFHRVYHAILDYCTVDLSAFYFDVLKDRLYTFAPKNSSRRSAQTAVYRIANALVRLLAPILVFTSEEVWKFLPRAGGDPESIHMALFTSAEELADAIDPARAKEWDQLYAVREEVLKALEPLRAAKTIAANLEARVTLSASGDLAKLLQKYAPLLPALFIVSQVAIDAHSPNGSGSASGSSASAASSSPSSAVGNLKVTAEKAHGTKCQRCWNYSTHVGESAEYPTLCERCVAALDEINGAVIGSAKS